MPHVIDKEKLKELHSKGLDDYEITKEMGVSFSAIFSNRKKLGLPNNGKRKFTINITRDGFAECSRCKEIKSIKEFRKGKLGHGGNFQLSFCNKCFQKQRIDRANGNLKVFLKERVDAIKTRSKNKKIQFSITVDDLLNQYKKQEGKCFYTGVELIAKRGEGKHPNALSVDRKDASLGYLPKNIVLCANRINGIKNNLSLQELKELIPTWYEKLTR